MKASSFILIFLGFLQVIISPHFSFAQTVSSSPIPAYAVIINQIRGESCCSPGSLENTRTQLENAVKYELPTTFVLRYDALTDPRYTDLILKYQRLHPDLIQTGVMVEIIPSLITFSNKRYCSNKKLETLNSKYEKEVEGQRTISAAEISEKPDNNKVPDEFLREEIGCCPENTCEIQYKGTSETWFQAQNAFTIGYSLEARTVILDTLLAQYQKVFGTYPKVSSAWMIDTDSVNYLHDRYGVVTHQITREQWGTDSYTLYGGPPHYPYPASRNWIMNPDFDNAQAVTIVRQTVTDPLYNYGDTSSSYTSQPNDYMRGGRGIEYFKTLLDNATRQKSTGFANIGLENSMGGQYQDEYARQLEYIAKLRYENKLSVVFPDAVGPIFQNQKITAYARTDGDRQAIWITTPQYRARIIRSNKEVSITDLRLYSEDLKDPYSSRVAKHEGYWVVPFLIDGSRWYTWKDMEKSPHKFIPVASDLFTDPSRITIGKMEPNYQLLLESIKTNTNEKIGSYSADGRIITDTTSHFVRLSVTKVAQAMNKSSDEYLYMAYFYPDRMTLQNERQFQQKVPYEFPVKQSPEGSLTWNLKNKTAWSMMQKSTDCEIWCEYSLNIDPVKFIQATDTQYPYLYPESMGRALSNTYTRVSVNNTFALAGRNPVRLVLEPHDAMNFPIILDKEAEIIVDPDDTAVTRLGKLISSQQQYIDLDRSDPHKVSVTVKMNQKGKLFSVSKTVYFAPNCKKDWRYCVVHPIQGTWYILTKLTDWWSGRK